MRKIKFRGKRIYDGEWIYGNLITDDSLENHIVPFKYFYEDGHHLCYEDPTDKPVFVSHDSIGQYTGFKDKNGREIYEGDIVQRVNDTPISFPDGSKKYMSWMVNFNYGGWRFEVTPCSPAISYPAFYSNAQDMEIIGNIYENPELLEATK